jgi:hypothetical protein
MAFKIDEKDAILYDAAYNNYYLLIDGAGYPTSCININQFQKRLISGTNIKTINNIALLGAGDITLSDIGAGNVYGPPSSSNSNVVLFNGVSGKYIKDSGLKLSGSNTGDETETTIKSKLNITILSGNNTGDQDLSGYVEKIEGKGLSSIDVTAQTAGYWSGKQDVLGYTPENVLNKGVNNGYCGLDAGGKVPISNLPSTLLKYQSAWSPITNTPTLTNNDVSKAGYVYIISEEGDLFGKEWGLGDWLVYNADGVIEKSDNSDDVMSVNGKVGIIVLNADDIDDTLTNHKFVTAADLVKLSNLSGNNTGDQDLSGLVPNTRTINSKALNADVTIDKSDVGLSNVDNTSDNDKPVSSATSTALSFKSNTGHGHSHTEISELGALALLDYEITTQEAWDALGAGRPNKLYLIPIVV